jgi:predicted nucleic acid-binding protein
LASINGGVAVVDDSAARKVADCHGVEHIGTLGLLCESIRSGLLTVPLVAQLADHLLEGEYRPPFLSGGFETWASDNGLVG